MRTLLAIKGYPASGIPSTIVLDRQGRVAHIWLKAIDDPQQMIDMVGAIAAEQS
jgi:peroxiredoxin